MPTKLCVGTVICRFKCICKVLASPHSNISNTQGGTLRQPSSSNCTKRFSHIRILTGSLGQNFDAEKETTEMSPCCCSQHIR